MKTIYKYPLVLDDEQIVALPLGAVVLSAANQNGALALWALVDTEARMEPRRVRLLGTGNPAPANPGRFIASVQMAMFVWHVFID